MKKLVTAVLVVAFSMAWSTAEARRYRHQSPPEFGMALNPMLDCPMCFAPVEQRTRIVVRRSYRAVQTSDVSDVAHARYIHGRLVCAINVNAELAARGIPGTGSAMAKSFLSWGSPTEAQPGAVAVFNRGRGKSGHVAIVHSVRDDGTIMYLNPGRRGWRVGPMNKRPIAFRVA